MFEDLICLRQYQVWCVLGAQSDKPRKFQSTCLIMTVTMNGSLGSLFCSFGIYKDSMSKCKLWVLGQLEHTLMRWGQWKNTLGGHG